MRRTCVWKVLTTVALIALVGVIAGCGGSSGGAAPDGGNGDGDPVQPTDSGRVAGQILYYTTDEGLENIEVTINGVTGRTDANGNFLIEGIPPGEDLEVILTLPDWLALPVDDPILVDVVADQRTTLPAPIRLVEPGDRPPRPWEPGS
ncbi:MAG: hypothetical protein ACLFWB_10255 [Armatimonadota bacterium]